MTYTPEQISSIVLKVLKEIETPELTLEQKIELAENHNTPPEVLIKLGSDKDAVVLSLVAYNPNTPPEVLSKLASNKDWKVRYWVARNPNTPPEVLIKLASDEDWTVRRRVAANPNTPQETLEVLASDKDDYVRNTAKKNLEENYKTNNLKLTTNQYNALKTLITASQDENLKGLMDS